MIERGLAVFLISLFALGFLIGPFEGGRDLLVTAALSAVVALTVVLWLRRDERRDENEYFDERATRRAVRRGVMRTALAAVIPLFVISIAVGAASTFWQTHGGRAERFAHVAKYGFFVGHPGLRPAELRSDHPYANFRSLELLLHVLPRSATPLVQRHTVGLRLDLRGRFDEDPPLDLPPSGEDAALAGGAATLAQLRAFERLSEFAVASAAVELSEPLSVADFHQLLNRYGLLDADGEGVAILLEDRGAPARRIDMFDSRRVGWPNPFVAQFQAWAKGLRGGDDSILERLGLPSSRELRALATQPRIHGFVLDAATPRQLRGLQAEIGVAFISLGDVAFVFRRDR